MPLMLLLLFFSIVYIRIITLTLTFQDHPLVENPLSQINKGRAPLTRKGHDPPPRFLSFKH